MIDNNQAKEVLEELQTDMLNPELIQDNKLHFRIEQQLYSVEAPSQKSIAEANNLKNNTYFTLLQQKNKDGTPAYLMENNLIKLLKESQNIDIAELSTEINDNEKELMNKYLELANLKDSDKKGILKAKKEIDDIKTKRLEKVLTKAEYLAPSIQNQANDVYYKFLTAMCTKQYIENKDTGHWVKSWKNFDEYNSDNSKLTYIALGRLTELMLNV